MIIFLIPVITSSFVSKQALNILFEQSELLANEIIARRQDDINVVWAECERVFENIYLNNDVQRILGKSKNETVSPMESYYIKEEISSLSYNRDAINDIWIVFNNTDFIASTSRCMASNVFFAIEKESIFTKEQIENRILKEIYNGQLLKATDSICYLKTIRCVGRPDSYATLVIKIQPDYMNRYESLYNDEGVFFLLNEENELIYSNKKFLPELLNDIISSAEGEQTFESHNTKYLKYERNSLNAKHIYAIPYTSISGKAYALSALVLIASTLSILLGIFSIRYFVKKNIRPINEIMKLVGGLKSMEANEYSIIMDNLKLKNQHSWEMSNKLNAFKPLVMQSILEQLLVHGNLNTSVSNKLDISFESPYFRVILIDVQDLGDFQNLENGNNLDDAVQLSFVALSNIFIEYISTMGKAYSGEIDDTIVIILNTDNVDQGTLHSHIENAYEMAQKYLKVTARIIISESANGISELPLVYQRGLNRLEYSAIMEETGIASSVDVDVSNSPSQANRTDIFVSQILSGDKNAAMATINTVLKESALSHTHSSKYNLANMLALATDKLSEQGNTVPNDDVLKVIMTTNKMIDVHHRVEEFVSELCAISEQALVQSDSTEKQVCEYINNNFSCPDINVKIIASTFRITPSYLSAKFKQKYGMSMLEYINQVRINHAKELLRSSDLSIESIYIQCGYISKTTFLRQFKKICGVTPATYREIR